MKKFSTIVLLVAATGFGSGAGEWVADSTLADSTADGSANRGVILVAAAGDLPGKSAATAAKSPLWAARTTKPDTQGAAGSSYHPPTYLQDVAPIFMGKCFRCHNQQVSFLNNFLDYRKAFVDRVELKRRVWDSWKGDYFKQSMPIANSPESEAITQEERAVIKEWVNSGAAYGVPPKDTNPRSKAERMEVGKRLFTTICAACHQPTGQGIPNRFPPLAGSDFLNSDKQRAIQILLNGLQGEVVVNGMKFNNSMPMFPLTDSDVASALTYVLNSFGNSGQEVTTDEVKALRGHPVAITGVSAHPSASNRPTEPSPWE